MSAIQQIISSIGTGKAKIGDSWTRLLTGVLTPGYYATGMSADGRYMVATLVDGSLIRSTDFGVSWSTVQGANCMAIQSCAVSDSGQYMYIPDVSGNNLIRTSSDYGVSWLTRSPGANRQYRSIACSSDGSKVLACQTISGYVSRSTDYGNTWSNLSPELGDYQSICSSADGTKLAFVADYGYIYTSSDSGANWVERTGPGAREWRSIACSSDGTKLVACVWQHGYAYISTDSGGTWTAVSLPTSDGSYYSNVSCSGIS